MPNTTCQIPPKDIITIKVENFKYEFLIKKIGKCY